MGENDPLQIQISPLSIFHSTAVCNRVSPQIKIKIFKIIMPAVVTKTAGKLALKLCFVDEILFLMYITKEYHHAFKVTDSFQHFGSAEDPHA
jgi:hypothetical protein